MLLLIVSSTIFLFTSVQINRYFHYRKWLDWFLGGFLILISLIILVMTVSGLFYQMNKPLFVLGFQIILLALSIVTTLYLKPPQHPFIPFPFPKITKNEKKLSFPVIVFLIVSGVVAVLNLVYVLLVPPNNNDSLAIHLARIGI